MSNHHHATTERPADVSTLALNPLDEFDRYFLDAFADTALPTGAGVDWDAYPDPADYDPDDDNPEVA